MTGVIKMATQSFLKTIDVRDKASGETLADALIRSETVPSKQVEVINHQFNWWFDSSPPKGYITARPKGRYRKLFYWSAIKRYYSNPLSLILLLAPLYTFALLRQ